MKKLPILLSFFLITFSVQKTEAQHVSISYSTFFDALSPYGQWINYAPYGNVWIYNQRGFTPYYDNGYWAYTNMGWTWVSGYDWGWAPFHYGRWVHSFDYGWMWIPGYEWAPAWVSWSRFDNYYGWAPLGYGMGFNSFNLIPAHYWVFTQQQYLNSPYFRNYCLDRNRNTTIVRQARQINNVQQSGSTRYQSGPALNEVRSVTKTPVQMLTLNPVADKTKASVSGKKLNIFKPVIEPASATETTIAPVTGKKQNAMIQTDKTEAQPAPVKRSTDITPEIQRSEQVRPAQTEINNNTTKESRLQIDREELNRQKQLREKELQLEQQRAGLQRQQELIIQQQRAELRQREEQARLQQQRNEQQKRQQQIRIQQQRAEQQQAITERNRMEQQERMQQREYRQRPSITPDPSPRRTTPLRITRQ